MNATEAVTLAEDLIEEFGLNGWVVALDRSKVRFGCCQHARHTISLSRALVELNTRVEVEDVIRHEIAHALVGSHHGHDRIWRAKCIEVGARPERTYDENVATPQRRWTLACPDCSFTTERHRRTKVQYQHDRHHGVLIWIDNTLTRIEEER